MPKNLPITLSIDNVNIKIYVILTFVFLISITLASTFNTDKDPQLSFLINFINTGYKNLYNFFYQSFISIFNIAFEKYILLNFLIILIYFT